MAHKLTNILTRVPSDIEIAQAAAPIPIDRIAAESGILPDELEEAILSKTEDLAMSGPGGLLEGYSAMAADADGEREAEEWSEGLIGDASAEG